VAKQNKAVRQRKLRNIDVKVLEGLAICGPRNKTKLAAQLNMPRETLRHRINYLRSHFSLYLQGNVYHTNIGLRKAMVLVESKPGYENFAYRCLKCNDYWLYVSRCIGAPRCIATYGIPASKEKEFESFIDELRELDQMSAISFFWSTCIHNVNTVSTWFDGSSENWIFPWDLWLEEIEACKGDLPYTIKEPDCYVQKADWIDIMILKELEKDCTIKLQEIAKKLNISKQRVKYHFGNHVIKKQMFEGHQILADHYRGLSPDTCLFIFTFKNYANFSKFACSLMNKPFARAMGKVYNMNQLFVRIYLPREQLGNFIETLAKLVRTEFLETYQCLIEDSTQTERQTISYEYFKDNRWKYDSERYLGKLQSVVSELPCWRNSLLQPDKLASNDRK
jgi:DNA-binding Lrp family transcriptional regulator